MKRLEYALSALAWFIALAIAGASLFAMFRFTHVMPFADQWDLTARLFTVDGPGGFWEVLWRPHNVHRLVLFNILNATDFWFFSASNSFNIVALACTAIASAVVFVLVLRAAGVERRSLALWAAPAAIAAIFNGAQSECLTWPLGLQWFLVNLFFLCAVLAMLSAAKAEAGKRSFAMAACILASIAASLSSGNGLLVWPVLVLLAIALRLKPLRIAGYAAAGAAVIALYLPGLRPADLPLSSTSLLDLLAYTARFIGNVWYWADFPFQGDLFASVSGYLVVTGAVALGVLLACRRLGRPQQALAAIVIFSVATGFLASTGRIGHGISQGYAPRYATAGGMLWAALLAWLAVQSAPIWAKRPAGVLAVRVALLFWALIALLAYQPRMLSTVAEWYALRERGALAIMTNVHDDRLTTPVYLESGQLFKHVDAFRARGISIFAEPRSRYAGKPLLTLAWPDDTACTGAAEKLEAFNNENGVPVSYRGYGWIDPPPGQGGAILIANRQGQVIGLGSAVAEARFPWDAPSPTRWFAVVRPGADAMGVFAIKSTAPAPGCALGAWILNP